MLAGDMRELGLELWSLRRREVPEGVQVHPALDRIAVQKVAAAEVKALVEARRSLRTGVLDPGGVKAPRFSTPRTSEGKYI